MPFPQRLEEIMSKTLIVVLEDSHQEVRIPCHQAMETGDTVIAVDDHRVALARFKLRDVRSWYVKDDEPKQ